MIAFQHNAFFYYLLPPSFACVLRIPILDPPTCEPEVSQKIAEMCRCATVTNQESAHSILFFAPTLASDHPEIPPTETLCDEYSARESEGGY